MATINTVVKGDGTEVPFDADKPNKMAEWASNLGVCWSSVVLAAFRGLTDRCSTKDIQTALIDECASRRDKAHMEMAARLYTGTMYKNAHGGFEVRPDLYDFYTDMVTSSIWEEMDYDASEIEYLGEILDHDKDLNYKYSTVKQITERYSKKRNGLNCETPQFTFMGISMKVMEVMPKERRLEDVIKLYTYLSDLKINMPTPFLSGLRTMFKGYASCAVWKGGDTAKSLDIVTSIAYDMTCAGAGLGGMIQTRSVGDSVRNGTIIHTGKLPYYRYIQGAVKATKQEQRGGGGTVHYTALDPEIETLLRLKHPTTVVEKQIRGLDYSVGTNKFFAEVANNNGMWMLMSYADCPELHEALYGCSEKFAEIYKEYERSVKPRTYIDAKDLLKLALNQRSDTGRIYFHWTDELNLHTPFKETIYSLNLCKEIGLPTKEYLHPKDLYDAEDRHDKGEIALCFLSCIVAGRVTPEEYEDVAYYTALAIDNVIDIMEYPYPHLEMTAKARRSIGMGVTNLAHYMATEGQSYTSLSGKNFMHRHAEMHSFYCHKASLRLAKERGVCKWINKTKYPQGWLPIDTYNKNVDTIHTQELLMDWEGLRKEIIEVGGLRNSVLEATPPAESSSQASETTNSLYPIRDYYVEKVSGKIKLVFGAPDIDIPAVADAYEIAWDIPAKDHIDTYAIYQKFHGQGISADIFVDFSKYEDERVPVSDLIFNYNYSTHMGLKAWYYQNSKGGLKVNSVAQTTDILEEDLEDDGGCAGGACKM
jgi:ribonucleoside-diphosphate reductase alpha chain